MRAVFLDRDGVINVCRVIDGKPYPPTSAKTFELAPEAVAACERLKDAGFILVVVTNQPDVGRGLQSQEEVDAMHKIVRENLPIDAIYVCTHGQDGECECRKPKPGMLHRAAGELGVDLSRSFLIGDRWRDIDCGYAAGCQTVLIDYHYAEQLRQTPDATVQSLEEAANWILHRSNSRRS